MSGGPNDGATDASGHACIECGQIIQAHERFLHVTSHDGVQRFVHTICFTSTTFDPDRYGLVTEPDSSR